MMHVLGFLLLTAFMPQTFAGHDDPAGPVYSPKSQLTVETINNAVEVIRDPTRMSESFRQAIKNIVPPAQANAPSTGVGGNGDGLPAIELVGKVLTPNKPAAVVLRIDQHSVHLPEGGLATTIVKGDRMLTVRVDEITGQHVKVMLVEINKPLILQ